jgi:tryptophan-rich sensory protein
MKAKVIGKLIFSILICQGAGFAGSVFTTPSIPTWYATLTKPGFTPPNWLFAPVWTFLYLLMGITLFMIWQKIRDNGMAKWAMVVFFVQLALNVLWSILFFGLHNPFLAFIEIIVLWIAILTTILLTYRFSRFAGSILIPYLLWVSFASMLNFALWQLNS